MDNNYGDPNDGDSLDVSLVRSSISSLLKNSVSMLDMHKNIKTNSRSEHSNDCDPLDASMVRSSVGALLKNSVSMLDASEISSIRKFDSVAEGFMNRPLVHGQTSRNKKTNDIFNRYDRVSSKTDRDVPLSLNRNTHNDKKNISFNRNDRTSGMTTRGDNGLGLGLGHGQNGQNKKSKEIFHRFESVTEDLMMRPLNHGQNKSDKKENDIFNRYNDASGKVNRDDCPLGHDQILCNNKNSELFNRYNCNSGKAERGDSYEDYLDIKSEVEVPLSDVKHSASSHSFMTSTAAHHEQLNISFEASMSLNRNHSNVISKNDSIRKSASMSVLKSSLAYSTPLAKNDRRGMHSQSILKSSESYSDAPKGMKRVTSFSTLEIREYPITLGDNPGGARGPPVSLDWKHDEDQTQVIPLETYEDMRSPRRSRSDLHMAENLRRWRLLREKGYSLRELERASKAAEAVRKQRKNSLKPNPVSKMKKKIGKLITSSTNELDKLHYM